MEYILGNVTEILLLLFLMIVFLQSSIDKIVDWKGNLSFQKQHFAKTFMKDLVPFLLATITVTELTTGILCTLGLYQIVVLGKESLALFGAIVACISLLMLLLGQRIAKDYGGAQTIVIYLVPAVFLVFLLQE
ncbi:DoxX family protein [Flavobacteriaceae bacterium F89]|uniref:DoxX family protein n=1 Tax=Cerina litoralis TaxID=2874477 RepID=A0AAE3EQI0_9FLAO|nr:DoxX family protein [Cerina litoralis]MCG2459207.1 DoxX family protein [Cerina litoralis]